MHPLARVATLAIRARHIQLERAEMEGHAVEVGKLLEEIQWFERQKRELER